MKKRILFVICLCMFSVQASYGFVRFDRKTIDSFSETKLLEMWTSLEDIPSGAEFNIFIKVATTFQAPQELRLVLAGRIGANAVPLQSISDGLWWYHSDGTLPAGVQTFAVDFILENKAETDEIRSEITAVEQANKEIETKIANEEDDAEKAILEAELATNLIELENLKDQILENQLLVKTETLNFEIQ